MNKYEKLIEKFEREKTPDAFVIDVSKMKITAMDEKGMQEAFIALAKEYGVELTAEDFAEEGAVQELEDDMLDEISGGTGFLLPVPYFKKWWNKKFIPLVYVEETYEIKYDTPQMV